MVGERKVGDGSVGSLRKFGGLKERNGEIRGREMCERGRPEKKNEIL